MLFGSNIPTSLTTLLATFQTLFTAPTFTTFSFMVTGFLAQTGEHNVCGMLSGAGLAQRWHHSRAHRFFSNRRWSVEQVGLHVASLAIQRLVPAGAAIQLVVDDTLFRRTGRKVFGERWCHDGSPWADAPSALATASSSSASWYRSPAAAVRSACLCSARSGRRGRRSSSPDAWLFSSLSCFPTESSTSPAMQPT